MAFTPLGYRIATLIGMAITSGLGFFLTKYMGLATALVVAPMALAIITFIDYFAFSGISTRKEKCMEIMKSSVYGSEVVSKALKTDVILKLITMVLCFAGTLIGCIMYEAGVLFVLAVMVTTMAVTELALIITRRKGLSIAVHSMVIYIMVTVEEGAMIALFLGFASSVDEEAADSMFANIVGPAVLIGMIALTVLLGIILFKDCVKGYMSGFCDDSETGVEK